MTERDVTDRVLTEKALTHLANAFKDREICSVETLRKIIASHRLLHDELEYERELHDKAVKRVTQLEQEIGALMR